MYSLRISCSVFYNISNPPNPPSSSPQYTLILFLFSKKQNQNKEGIVGQYFNPSTWKGEAGRSL